MLLLLVVSLRLFFLELVFKDLVSCTFNCYKNVFIKWIRNQRTKHLSIRFAIGIKRKRSNVLRSPPVCVGFVVFNLLFYVSCYVDHCLSFCVFSFRHTSDLSLITPLISSTITAMEELLRNLLFVPSQQVDFYSCKTYIHSYVY